MRCYRCVSRALLSLIAALLTAHSPVSVLAQGDPQYRIIKQFVVDSGLAAYDAIDSKNRRLFGAGSKVIDLDSDTIVGYLPATIGHAYAIANDLGVAVTRHAALFDLRTLNVIDSGTGHSGSTVVYDPLTHRAFITFDTVLVLDVAKRQRIGHLQLGEVRSAIVDAPGHVYFTTEGNSLIGLDARSLTVVSRWDLQGCASAYGMAVDRPHRRLFVSCANNTIHIVDLSDGRLVAAIPTCGQAAKLDFDAATKAIFVPGGDTLTVVREDTPDRYRVIANIPIRYAFPGVAVDAKTHRAYVLSHSSTTGPISVIVVGL